ncbi:FkbM family methyltransferase, partial [uncultured Hyphomonas sp.]|uniref:FkbM family methyltransferase n=1 Tax=uncultured Hyphomonas sp. TaxID=225298 RepID=UPI0030DD9A89
MTVSYAQQFEDVMLWRALKDVSNGAYIDIGANDPVVDSVSLLFYEKGWRGMHVEPMPEFAQRLREAREDEEVLEAAVGESDGEIELYSFGGTGLTTSIRQHAERHQKDGRAVELIKVPCLPLSKIFERFNRRHVHWLKIDVEGMEGAVLETWGESQIRPWIVVVESTLPNSQSPAYESWEHELTGRGYSFAYFDGLNRFYVHEDHQDRATAFSLPPNFFDYFSLSEHSPFSGHVAEKLHLAQNDLTVLEASLADLRHQRDHHAARLKEVTHSAESLEAALKQRDGHITRIEAELKQRNGQIESIETALKQRDGHIARI